MIAKTNIIKALEYIRLSAILLGLVFILSCSGSGDENGGGDENGDNGVNDWATSSLESEGLDAEKIHALSQLITNGDIGDIHCLLIVRNGYLVFEAIVSY